MFYQSSHGVIHESELSFSFCRSGGPGGQHVNKVSTSVQLRFSVSKAKIAAEMKQRLKTLAGKRMSSEGVIQITANQFRSQKENRVNAEKRLLALLTEAAKVPKKRKATKATKASQEKRLKRKQILKEKKQQRKKVNLNEGRLTFH